MGGNYEIIQYPMIMQVLLLFNVFCLKITQMLLYFVGFQSCRFIVFELLIVDFHESLLMLISLEKLIVDVDRKGEKVVINILVDPPMYIPLSISFYSRHKRHPFNVIQSLSQIKNKEFSFVIQGGLE